MSKEERRTPKLRFKGYTADWEQRKLKELGEGHLGGGTPKSTNELFWDGETPWLQSSSLMEDNIYYSEINRYITTEGINKSAAKLNPPNSIAIVTRVGVGKVIYMQEEYATSQDFLSLNNIKSDGIFSSYNIMNLMKRESNYLQGTSIKGIPNSSVLNLRIYQPENYREQTKIGSLLRRLDFIITKNQDKLNAINKVKLSFLQNIFASNFKYPKIRFKGFTESWQEESFSSVIQKIVDRRGVTPQKLGLEWSTTGYPALSALNVRSGHIDESRFEDFGSDELYNKWMKDDELYKGQVVFTTEAPMGNVARILTDNKYILSQRTMAFVPNYRVINDVFLFSILSSPHIYRRLKVLSSGGTAKGVSQRTLSELKLTIPSKLEEQTSIGKTLESIDYLINLQKNKIKKLFKLKENYLNQLFI